MKKLFIILLVFMTSPVVFGQTYQNEWINYDQAYYKFTVIEEGVYRIQYSVLQNAGLGNVPAEQFQLWRNGEEQPIYVSKSSGQLGSGDYIEFYGVKNDGKKDLKLYRKPDFQLSDHISLISDTSAYFLTVNTSGNTRKYDNADNNVAGNTLPAEKYFINTKGYYFSNLLNGGYAIPVGGVYLYSSAFDEGEGWTSSYITPKATNGYPGGIIGNLNVYMDGPSGSFRYAAVGSAFNSRTIKVKFNETFIDEVSMPYFNYVKRTIPEVPLNLLANPNWVSTTFYNGSNVETDRFLVSFWELTYPSTFVFNDEKFFYFELPQTNDGNYLEITRFDNGGVAPVLYDRSSMKRYVGDISVSGKVRFALPASSLAKREFVLVTQETSAIKQITSLTKRQFIDFSKPANQGNYIIISNPLLYTSTSGKDHVEEYRQYRASAQGGSHSAITINIQELTDQFAYGIDKHPLGIKDFIQFADANFATKPEHVFLIGKGVSYDEVVRYKTSNYIPRLNLVPTFGSPASDILLSSGYGGVTNPKIPIGRLSAVSGDEVGNYLDKIKEYEEEQQSTDYSLDAKLWMKKKVQIVGGKDNAENGNFRNFMYGYQMLVQDTSLGLSVEAFSKTSNAAVQLVASKRIETLFEEGIGVLAYFGHSAANVLEYNLDDPQVYNNPSKYPLFIVSGCTAGNNFSYDTMRLISGRSTISEDFVLSKQRGSIGFMASTHYGIPFYLDEYNTKLYKLMGGEYYGTSVGYQMKKTIEELNGDNPNLYFYNRADLEEMNLHGDPAIKVHSQPKPDFVVEESLLKIDPGFISVSDQKFTIHSKVHNTGKAIRDSITWEIKRIHPDGKESVLYQKRIVAPAYVDSVILSVPIVSSTDKGLNKITITIDADNDVDEMSESNNSITKEFYIFEDEATPQYPQNFAIVNDDKEKMYASTANPLSSEKDYVFQIDTTELFNSPLKVSKQIRSTGGIIEFDPGFNYTDSTVYHWRVMVKTDTTTDENGRWNNSSFIYLKNSSAGSNQSDYYQHLYSDTQNIRLNENREWEYARVTNLLQVKSGVVSTAYTQALEYSINLNGTFLTTSPCGISGIIFTVFDPNTLKPWENTFDVGRFGSDPVCFETRIPNFQFNILSQEKRIAAYHFLKDSVPDGFIVVVRNISSKDSITNTYAWQWQGDTTVLGSGNSLYHVLFDNGFTAIDSFTRPKAFIFMYQKNRPEEFVPTFVFSKGISDKIELTHPIIAPDSIGYIKSPRFGPALSWHQMNWDGVETVQDMTNNPVISIIGIRNDGTESLIGMADKTQKSYDLTSVSSGEFPYIRLEMRNADSVSFEPFQLKYWRLNYLPAPEGALQPSLLFNARDTLMQGETMDFGIGFKNISAQAFDSMKIKVSVIDEKNVAQSITVPRQRPLVSGDTLLFNVPVATTKIPGSNVLHVDFNPDNDQPELHHFNNFIFHNFYVKPDNFNPLLDVTFDGVHILNRDIVSAKPHIVIKLKDENRFMKLSDTSLLKVQLKYPGPIDGPDILRTIAFDNDTLRFSVSSGDENTATIDYTPQFDDEDSEYELIVSGKDVVGNKAGDINYHVTFRVINKAMITEMLNYPNPFTTSTAFVFTLTGSEVPQNLRIQIMTVTGKVVREITKEELGPIKIGRNITEYKWDGTDMYGQPLANGVYLYRVLTNLNGKSLDKFYDKDYLLDPKHNFFRNGYGKMYLMR